MDKYVLVCWPEILDWLADEYEDDVILALVKDEAIAFVPEELYNQVNGQ